jgi:hypothetical protein
LGGDLGRGGSSTTATCSPIGLTHMRRGGAGRAAPPLPATAGLSDCVPAARE